MISVICAVACIAFVILDGCGKLHPERTRGQVLLNLFSLLGAATPTAAFAASNFLTSLSDNAISVSDFAEPTAAQNLLLTQGAPDWLILIGAAVCFGIWIYTLNRTAGGIRIMQPQEPPALAAKRQLTITWISLPFFLLMLILSVIQLIYVLCTVGFLAIAVLFWSLFFLPVLIIGALFLGAMSFWMLLGLLPFFLAMLLPYITGVFYSNRYVIACAACLGWKKPLRIFLQVVLFLPWLRWVVVCCCMGKMQSAQRKVCVS